MDAASATKPPMIAARARSRGSTCFNFAALCALDDVLPLLEERIEDDGGIGPDLPNTCPISTIIGKFYPQLSIGALFNHIIMHILHFTRRCS